MFYHSNAKPPGVVGTARVCREAYPDHFSWDPDSKYFDEKSSPESPRWFMVDVEFEGQLQRMVSLDELKVAEGLEDMVVTKRSRLSVQPVRPEEFDIVIRLAEEAV